MLISALLSTHLSVLSLSIYIYVYIYQNCINTCLNTNGRNLKEDDYRSIFKPGETNEITSKGKQLTKMHLLLLDIYFILITKPICSISAKVDLGERRSPLKTDRKLGFLSPIRDAQLFFFFLKFSYSIYGNDLLSRRFVPSESGQKRKHQSDRIYYMIQNRDSG
jgi:hypothetical protein